MGSTLNKTEARAGTRIPCEIPITLTSLDSAHPFSESCQIVLVNLRGCAVRCCRSVGVGGGRSAARSSCHDQRHGAGSQLYLFWKVREALAAGIDAR